MDTRTGELLTEEQARQRRRVLEGEWETVNNIIKRIPDTFIPTPEQLKRNRIGRNDLCPCGSKKKFKKCCMIEI